MSEKVKCPNPECKNGKVYSYYRSSEWRGEYVKPEDEYTICPVCHGTGFAPALTDIALEICLYCSKEADAEDCHKQMCEASLKTADKILSLTASHYTEKIKELEAQMKAREELYNDALHAANLLGAKLHQAEQETARGIIERIKHLDLMLLRFDMQGDGYTEIPFNDTVELQRLESKYGVRK